MTNESSSEPVHGRPKAPFLARDSNHKAQIESLPNNLESPCAKLVYLSLRTTSAQTAADLRDQLGLSLLTLYPILTMLVRTGVLKRTDEDYEVIERDE